VSPKKIEDLKLVDIRSVERNIRKGLVTRDQVKQFQSSLPDASDKAVPAEFDQAAELAFREEHRRQHEAVVSREAAKVVERVRRKEEAEDET